MKILLITGSPEEYPAENLSWYEARGFCEWLNETGLTKGEGVAGLPSEAQWEFACAGGEQTEYENGDGVAALKAAGWFDENSEGKTQPVRSKQANLFGLYDMHGNLWEWCRDAWDSEAYAKRKRNAEDPEVYLEGEETSGSERVLRGGSWFYTAAYCRSAFRSRELRRLPRLAHRFFGWDCFPARRLRRKGKSVASATDDARSRARDQIAFRDDPHVIPLPMSISKALKKIKAEEKRAGEAADIEIP